MRRVIIESPYESDNPAMAEENIRYARACVKDSISLGESPFASHIFFTQPGILCDRKKKERELGIQLGFEWMRTAHIVAVYTDRGISPGMQEGIEAAGKLGIPIEYRRFGHG